MSTSYRSMFSLAGKIAIVTGGAGIIGSRIVSALADHGATVAIVDINADAGRAVAKKVSEAYHAKVVAYDADIGDPKSVKALKKEVDGTLGHAEILFNNAATKTEDLSDFFAPVEEFDIKAWRDIMAINLDAMFLMAQSFGSTMAGKGYGSIIQTASIYGLLAPDPRIYEGSEYLGRAINTPPVYTASKAGVIGLTRHLATYWGPKGVRVNTLTPGGVRSGQNDEFQRRYTARIPLGRMADADDMTGAAVFLASDASCYVTGQNIVVDGGLSAW